MENILVCTDLSADAKAAYPVAIELAKTQNCRLHLMFVCFDIPAVSSGYAIETPVWNVDPEVKAKILESQRQHFDSELRSFGDSAVSPHFIETSDLPSAEISKKARELSAKYIVMSSHGRTGFARIVMGSVTERVLQSAHCPVVVVPSKKATT